MQTCPHKHLDVNIHSSFMHNRQIVNSSKVHQLVNGLTNFGTFLWWTTNRQEKEHADRQQHHRFISKHT